MTITGEAIKAPAEITDEEHRVKAEDARREAAEAIEAMCAEATRRRLQGVAATERSIEPLED